MDIDRLRKVLEFEARKGYADTAVIGGLDSFVQNFVKNAAAPVFRAQLMDRIVPHPAYAAMDKKQRQDWASAAIDLLGKLERPPAPEAPPQMQPPVVPQRRPNQPAGVSPGQHDDASQDDGDVPERMAGPHKFGEKSVLNCPITIVKGVSAALEERFGKLGVETIRDTCYFFPRRHLDYSRLTPIASLRPGQEYTIVATIWEARAVRLGNMRCTEAIVGDDSGNIRAIWFNQPYLANKFRTNEQIVLSGKISAFRGVPQMDAPAWEYLEDKELIHTGRLVPIYPLTAGLYPRQVRRIVKDIVDTYVPLFEDFLPYDVKQRCRLLNLDEAISQAHYPDSLELKDRARERLAFDELFLLQLGVLSHKQKWQASQPTRAMKLYKETLDKFLGNLPFQLTAAQQRSLNELLADLERPRAMSRLLQGDVGSGKTVVALAGLLMAVANGCQGVVMAPTEILAEQHFGTFSRLLAGTSGTPLARIALLTGSSKGKKTLHRQIAGGEVDIVVGTHAVIQQGVEFPNLGLAVIDEQHRFGVVQRTALREKGFNPHMLVMTATPIPRSLALTLYGDLDLSIIDELPPGRMKILTKCVMPEKRQAAYQFVRQEIEKGRQAFIICPLIEESESIEARAAVEEYQRLSQQVFPDLRLGLLHGKMAAATKEETMRLFRDHSMDILVSTSVVEVGIDVPNATVMLVEGADRFGLSQLHQFRGRVGRGTEKSYCLLLAEDPTPEGQERMKLIENTHDGFKLAEEDLRLRGPGEFFGTRQSGMPDLRMARISDLALLEKARREAQQLFARDPKLELPQYQTLRKEMSRVWKEGGEWS